MTETVLFRWGLYGLRRQNTRRSLRSSIFRKKNATEDSRRAVTRVRFIEGARVFRQIKTPISPTWTPSGNSCWETKGVPSWVLETALTPVYGIGAGCGCRDLK